MTEWLTTLEAGELLGLSHRPTTISMLSRHHVEGYKEDGGHRRWFWNRQGVEQLFAEREVKRERRAAGLKYCPRCQIEEGSDWSCFDRMALERMGDGPGAQRPWDDLVAMAMAVTQRWIWEPCGYEGVLNFDNPDFWPDGEPPWAYAKEFLGCLGDHCFWR